MAETPAVRLDSPVAFAGCAVLAGALMFIVSPEQALLGTASSIGCVWCLQDREEQPKAWTAWATYASAGCALVLVPWRWQEHAEEGGARRWLLTDLALLNLALKATRLPRRLLPFEEFLPWCALTFLEVALLLGGKDAQMAAGAAIGRMQGAPLVWALVCATASTGALVGWSLWWAGGDHGPIQEALGPILSPSLVVVFAVINAFGEEVEFRMLTFGGLLANEEPQSLPLQVLAIALHSAVFAALHVAAGFPSGASGGSLVFIWSVFLGILRLWAGGMLLVFLLHFQADIVVFSLILLEERRRGSREQSCDELDVP